MAKILIVDDQKNVLLTLESILGKAGHYTVSATSTFDALEKLTEQKFDLIITDAVMPGKSGFALIRAVRMAKDLAHIPIIMLTGKREKEDVQRGIEAGANDYIIKPLDPEILMAKINGLFTAKGKASSSFQECPINTKANFHDETEIISISEVGMTLISNVSVAVGTKIKLKTDLFDQIGIQTPFLRVVSCSEPDKDTNRQTLTVHFIGFSEKEFQPLRLFITSKRKSSAA